jgi:hypothetical protein
MANSFCCPGSPGRATTDIRLGQAGTTRPGLSQEGGYSKWQTSPWFQGIFLEFVVVEGHLRPMKSLRACINSLLQGDVKGREASLNEVILPCFA